MIDRKKNALVVGGSGGIGTESIKNLIKRGMKVYFTYCKNKNKAEDLVESLAGQAEMFHVNLSDRPALRSVVENIIEKAGVIDVVVHCAAAKVEYKPVQQLDWKVYEYHINTQTKSMFEIVNTLFAQIKNGQRVKFIVILTEYCCGAPPNSISPYITAKYSLKGFSKAMAVELAKYQCTFNMISPGMTDTEFISNLPPKLIQFTAEKNPLRRIATVNDVAATVGFLASDNSDYLNGVDILINGGGVMR